MAWTVLQNSIIRRASKPVQLTPLLLSQLPIKRKGLTEFTFSRYLCPFLCNYEGVSVFLDADILVLCDIWELEKFAEPRLVNEGAHIRHDVLVVKNPALRFEWPSLMVFNNAQCKVLTPEWIDDEANQPQTLKWANFIGELPSEYNHCVGYDKPREDAKIVHFTQGVPCFEETKTCEWAKHWQQELNMTRATVPWAEIMGNSVHREVVMHRLGLGNA